jgi:hypothetical protein
LAAERIEELTAVRMIIGTPDQSAFAQPVRGTAHRLFRPVAPAEEIAVADGIVSGVQRLAFPAKSEQAFGYAALVARILIDWTPALGRQRTISIGKVLRSSTRQP